MIEWMASPITEHLGWVLIHFVWQGALVALLFALALAALQRSAPNARYAAGLVALALLAVLPVATWWFLDASSGAGPTHAEAGAESLEYLSVAAPSTQGAAEAARTNGNVLYETWHLAKESLEPILPWITGLWGLGVVVMSLRTLGGWIVVRRLCRNDVDDLEPIWEVRAQALAFRMGLERSFRLLQSARVEGPLTVGTWRPVILVPVSVVSGLPPVQVQALIAHELAHIRRYDYAINWVQTTLETLLFFHPAVWWISHHVRIEREHCCDDLAVESCGDPRVYSRALASAETRRQTASSLALAADGGSLLSRIQRLVAPQEHQPPGGRWAAGVGMLIVCGGLVLAGAYLPGPEGAERTTPSIASPVLLDPPGPFSSEPLRRDTTETERDTVEQESERKVHVYFREDTTTVATPGDRPGWLSFFRSTPDSMSRFNLRADTLIRRLSDGWRTGREELFFSDPRANLDSLLRHSRERVVFDSDSLMRFFFEGDSAHVRFRARADTIEVPSAPDIPPFPRPSTRWSDEEQETLRREMQQLREEMQALQRELHEKNRAMQELQRELRSEMVHLQREELEAQVEEARRQARENREHVRESRQLVAEQLRQEGERLRAEAEALPEGDERRARLLELSNRLLERAEQIQSLLREDDSSQG